MRRLLAQLIMRMAPGVADEIGRRQAVLARRREARRQAARHRQLIDAACTDHLTMLANRRAFDECLRRHLEAVRTSRERAALILIDLDHFKRLNDLCGHTAGDQALQAVARVLSSQTRARADRVFRIGGEEFAVVTSHCLTRDQLHRMAQRLITAIARERVTTGTLTVPLTASAGATFLDAGDTETSTVLARADAQLYAAKRDGRNRACA